MTNIYPVNTALTDQTILLPGARGGSLKCFLSFGAIPSAGAATVQYRPPGVIDWQPLAHVTDYALTGQFVSFRIDGPVAQIRILFDGLDVEGPAILLVDWSVIPIDAFSGLAAIITQPYAEANVKNGLEYYFRVSWPLADPIPINETRYIFIEVGDKPVIAKLRGMQYSAEELQLTISTGAVVTGGTPIIPSNWNRRLPTAPASTVTVTKDPTVTDPGTPFNESPEYFFGASNAPQRNPNSIPQGRERILPENTSYLVAIENTGVGSARVEYFLDWYEGVPDLPL